MTPAHVAAVTAAVTPARVAVAEANGIDLATTDAVLTEAARALGPEDTAKAVRRWVAGIDPDGTLDDAAGLPRIFRWRSARRPDLPVRAPGPGRRGDRARGAGGADERRPARR